jgi:threonine synthase
VAAPSSCLTHLECTACGRRENADQLQTTCPACGKVLYARYDLDAVRRALPRDALAGREPSLWRYRELLPVRDVNRIVTLGEGMTPLLPAPRLGAALGCSALWVKDEGVNPTGSFKARGQAVAVSRALELGARTLAVPSAGNAGGAMAAYAARAGAPAQVFMPRDVPPANAAECVLYGARLHLVAGLIGDCGRLVRQGVAARGWFDLSTLREPYRQEGKKTMGYEIAEQLGWTLPDAVIYPTGGGTGIVGMWKAFEEMEQLGWIDGRRPKMISVQAAGCAPIVRAFEHGERHAEPWRDAHTAASGLRVPAAIGDYLMLDAIRASGGTALAVSDEAMIADMRALALEEGISAAPEGAATLAALRLLLARGVLRPDERIVLFNTGAAWKYTDLVPMPALPVLDPDDPAALDGVATAG